MSMNAEPTASTDVQRMAKAICADPDLYDLAVTIARWQLVLLKVRVVRNAAIEPRRTNDPKGRGRRGARARSTNRRGIGPARSL
jgi:hypothetical protein